MIALQAYQQLFRTSLREHLTYRANFFIEMLGSLSTTVIAMALWNTLYSVNETAVIGGYTKPMMLTYLLGVGLVEASLHVTNQGGRQLNEISDGTLNAHLLKPMSAFWFWFVNDLARKLVLLSLALVSAVVAVALFWPLLQPPAGFGVVGLFLVALIAGALIHYFLFCTCALGAFWLGRSWGLTFLLRVTMLVATGALVPLDLLPETVREIFLVLPFQFFGYVPTQILLGNLNGAELLATAGLGLAWLVGLGLAAGLVYSIGLRSYGAYGG